MTTTETPQVDGMTMEQFQQKAKEYTDAFGEQGAAWFVQGKTFDECRALQFQGLQTQFNELKETVDAKDERIAELEKQIKEQFGEDPIDTGDPPAEGPKKQLINIVGE